MCEWPARSKLALDWGMRRLLKFVCLSWNNHVDDTETSVFLVAWVYYEVLWSLLVNRLIRKLINKVMLLQRICESSYEEL